MGVFAAARRSTSVVAVRIRRRVVEPASWCGCSGSCPFERQHPWRGISPPSPLSTRCEPVCDVYVYIVLSGRRSTASIAGDGAVRGRLLVLHGALSGLVFPVAQVMEPCVAKLLLCLHLCECGVAERVRVSCEVAKRYHLTSSCRLPFCR